MADNLLALNGTIISCERCPRLNDFRRRTAREKRRAFRDQEYWGRPVPSVGDPGARVLMVGLAPGAHGSNRTGRMFTGDGSGDFLTPALYRAGFANQPTSMHVDDGLVMTDLYMTAVVHCAPPSNKPTIQEIENCRPYLVRHLRVLKNVQVIFALGRVAFDGTLAALHALGLEVPSPRPAFRHGAEYRIDPYSLVAAYHPSRQNTQTRRLTRSMFEEVLIQVKRHLR